jgi:hypothetical protein
MGAMAGGCSILKPHSEWRDAAVDPESGNVIAWSLQYRDRADEPVVIGRDYAMYLVWNNMGERRFYLYDNRAKKYFGTGDFAKFLAALDAMPKGITFEWIDTCTVLRSYEMPAEEREKFHSVMKAGNRETSRGDDWPGTLACYCESSGFKYPPFTTGEDAWRDAVIDPATKSIVIMWMDERWGDWDPALLHLDYGMFSVWNQYEGRHFYLFDNKAKKFFGTTDFTKFIAAINAMPKGITLEWVDTCLLSRSHEMPDAERKQLDDALKAGNRETTVGDHFQYMVETCSARRLVFLFPTTGEEPNQ